MTRRVASLAISETDVITGAETCVRVGASTRNHRGRRDSLCPEAAVRAVPERLLLLCLLLRSSWLTVEGDRHGGAAGVLHRRGGRAVVAVSVGMPGCVPYEQSRRLRLPASRLPQVARSSSLSDGSGPVAAAGASWMGKCPWARRGARGATASSCASRQSCGSLEPAVGAAVRALVSVLADPCVACSRRANLAQRPAPAPS